MIRFTVLAAATYVVGLWFAIVLATGCTTRLGDFSVMTNRNMPAQLVKTKIVRGSDCAPIFLWWTIGEPNLEAAVDDAMEVDPSAEMLVDVTVETSRWSLILFGSQCFKVKGTLARVKSY